MQLVKVEGWDLDVAAEDEPRVRDLTLGERAGMKRPRDVRQLVDRNREELEMHGSLEVRGTAPRTSGGAPASEYWLNEGQAMALVALMRTRQAAQLRYELIRVYREYRAGRLPKPLATLPLDVAHGPRVGEIPDLRQEIAQHCEMASRASGRSIRAIHGYVRRLFRVPGIYFLSALAWPLVKQTITTLALEPARLSPPKARPTDKRQLSMWRTN